MMRSNALALFVDLSHAFDSADLELLLNRLSNIGTGDAAITCLRNYLKEHPRYFLTDGFEKIF